jgi:TonB family protein
MPRYRIAVSAGVMLVAVAALLPLVLQAENRIEPAASAGANAALVVGPDPTEVDEQRERDASRDIDQDERNVVVNETMPQVVPESLVRPEYPESARKAGVEGRVILKVVVMTNGRAAEPITPVQEVEGYPEFTENSIKVIRLWRFKPGTRRGEPVDMEVQIPIEFKLDDCKDQSKRVEKHDDDQ